MEQEGGAKGHRSRMTMVIYNLKYAVGGYFKAQFKIMVIVGLILLCGFLIWVWITLSCWHC